MKALVFVGQGNLRYAGLNSDLLTSYPLDVNVLLYASDSIPATA